MYRDATNDTNQITIQIPSRPILSVMARSVLCFLVVASLPWIGSVIGSSSDHPAGSGVVRLRSRPSVDEDPTFLRLLVQDLIGQGLVKHGDRAVLIGRADRRSAQIVKERGLDLIAESDVQRQRSVPENSLDFVFVDAFSDPEFVDLLKIGGIAAVRLAGNPSTAFRVPINFKIVYIRHFDATVVAMRKIRRAGGAELLSPTRRRLFALPSSKRTLLNGLEEALLEPPLRRRKRHLRRTKYLPDLTGDSLAGYPRRVFIDVGAPGRRAGRRWFKRNYPTRELEFEMYEVETEAAAAATEAAMGMTEWLRGNVVEEEYVVMKAEAEVVEEILESRAIELVDELFMECRFEGQKGKKKEMKGRRRAYWECLALYGKVRDEGVAVHQWWG